MSTSCVSYARYKEEICILRDRQFLEGMAPSPSHKVCFTRGKSRYFGNFSSNFTKNPYWKLQGHIMHLYFVASYMIFSSVKFGDFHVNVLLCFFCFFVFLFFYIIWSSPPPPLPKRGEFHKLIPSPKCIWYSGPCQDDNISCSSYKQFTRDWSWVIKHTCTKRIYLCFYTDI